MNNEHVRAFLAAELPDRILEHLERIQNSLKESIDGVRWVNPAGIHLTLKFFGSIETKAIGVVSEVVRKRAALEHNMVLAPADTGVFPNTNRPRVLWVGLRGDIDALSRLQAAIEEDLETRGFPRESRPFRPHLTLGRVRQPRGQIPGLADALSRAAAEPDGELPLLTVDGLTLFRSDLTQHGAVYTRLERYPFGEAAPEDRGE
jgi:RNA 2',3'-cyclic 3'-phosphodiesterase